MIRRLVWMVAGASVGAVTTVYALAGIRRARAGLAPRTVPGRVAGGAHRARRRVQDAVDDGRRARHDYEARALARHRARPVSAPGRRSGGR